MLICSYDTETTGIVDPIYPVEIGAILLEVDDHYNTTREVAVLDLVVRPDGYEVPLAASRVHGISHRLAESAGIPAVIAVAALTHLWAVADVRVAHNAEYDDKVVEAAIARLGRASTLTRPPGYCTKEIAAQVLNLPPTAKMIAAGYGGKPKPPRLDECYRFFFDEEVVGAHGAIADARACARVFVELLRRGVVSVGVRSQL
jgi:DNA polymerase-3 subunit epsilon